MGVVHIAGDVIVIGDRYMRQRCSWCGAALVDYDLALIAVPVGQDPTPGSWEPGGMVRIDGNMSYVEPGDQLPEDACGKLDPAATL